MLRFAAAVIVAFAALPAVSIASTQDGDVPVVPDAQAIADRTESIVEEATGADVPAPDADGAGGPAASDPAGGDPAGPAGPATGDFTSGSSGDPPPGSDPPDGGSTEPAPGDPAPSEQSADPPPSEGSSASGGEGPATTGDAPADGQKDSPSLGPATGPDGAGTPDGQLTPSLGSGSSGEQKAATTQLAPSSTSASTTPASYTAPPPTATGASEVRLASTPSLGDQGPASPAGAGTSALTSDAAGVTRAAGHVPPRRYADAGHTTSSASNQVPRTAALPKGPHQPPLMGSPSTESPGGDAADQRPAEANDLGKGSSSRPTTGGGDTAGDSAGLSSSASASGGSSSSHAMTAVVSAGAMAASLAGCRLRPSGAAAWQLLRDRRGPSRPD